MASADELSALVKWLTEQNVDEFKSCELYPTETSVQHIYQRKDGKQMELNSHVSAALLEHVTWPDGIKKSNNFACSHIGLGLDKTNAWRPWTVNAYVVRGVPDFCDSVVFKCNVHVNKDKPNVFTAVAYDDTQHNSKRCVKRTLQEEDEDAPLPQANKKPCLMELEHEDDTCTPIELAEDANPGTYRLRQNLISFMFTQLHNRHPDIKFRYGKMSDRINEWLCENHKVVIEMNRVIFSCAESAKADSVNADSDNAKADSC